MLLEYCTVTVLKMSWQVAAEQQRYNSVSRSPTALLAIQRPLHSLPTYLPVYTCHSGELVATIFSSGVDVLAVPWVSVAFRIIRMRCHGDSVSPVPLHSVGFFEFSWSSVGFYELLITVWIQSL